MELAQSVTQIGSQGVTQYRITCGDGSTRHIKAHGILQRDSLGEPSHIIGVAQDITPEKQAQETLELVNMELKRASRMKDEFLASMSHELRTPLTGILGLSEALQLKTYGDLSEKQLKTLKTIEESGRHLLDLINDILDLSKIEAGKLELQFAPCSLSEICQASLQLTRGMAQKKFQTIRYTASPQPLIVQADTRRLKQILVNLLSNAVKFTREGGGNWGWKWRRMKPDGASD
jgi:signal transduction histidine kinase